MLKFKKTIFLKKPQTFIKGLGVFILGVRHAFLNKSLLGLALIPILVAILGIFFGFKPLFRFYLSEGIEIFLNKEAFDFFGGAILFWISEFIFKILVAFLTLLTFYILLQVIYIPVCSLLAERVLVQKNIIHHKSTIEALAFNLKMFKMGLIKSVVLIFAGFFCFISSFIPGLSFIPIYFTLIVLAYDSFDYGLELYGLSLKDRILFIKKEFMLINGHGGVLFLLSFIPGLILLILPFSVIGASLLIGESNGPKRKFT